jgi:hypothetical protein
LTKKAKSVPPTDLIGPQNERQLENLPTINRFILVAEPTNGLLEWARKFPDEDPALTLGELQEDSSAYLIPHTDPDSWLEQNYMRIFRLELDAWSVDHSCWPKDLSFKTFKEFFNVRFCSIVIDMAEGLIKRIYI